MNRYEIAGLLFLICFIVQAVYFLLFTPSHVPYDEAYHVGLSRVFQDAGWGLPALSPGLAKYGPFIREPWLFHYLAGRFLSLKPPSVSTLIWLRGLSLCLVVGSLVVTWKLYRLIVTVPSSVLFAWAIQLNLLMFVYFAGVVSPDHLQNLLAVSCYLCVFLYLKGFKAIHLWTYLLLCFMACFTKQTFLPIAVLCTGLVLGLGWWLSRERRRHGFFSMVWTDTLRMVRAGGAARWVVAGALAFGAANAWLYGGNLLRYGSMDLDCNHIFTHDQCLANDVYARDIRYADQPPQIASYVFGRYLVNWIELMTERTLGILAHESVFHPRWVSRVVLAGVFLLLIPALLELRRLPRWEPGVALLIGLAYALFLAAWTMPVYLKTGAEGFAVHGRHLFPVLPLLLSAFAYYGHRPYRGGWRTAVLALVMAVFATLGFPSFLVLHEGWAFSNHF